MTVKNGDHKQTEQQISQSQHQIIFIVGAEQKNGRGQAEIDPAGAAGKDKQIMPIETYLTGRWYPSIQPVGYPLLPPLPQFLQRIHRTGSTRSSSARLKLLRLPIALL